MITISKTKIKSFSQTSYDDMIEALPFHKLLCTCGRKGDLIKHGRYTRYIKVSLSSEPIKILRVLCKSCGKTHAILPEWLVPYSTVLLKHQLDIIKAYLTGKSTKPIMTEHPIIDESAIGHIIRRFKRHWMQRLASYNIPVDSNIIFACFQTFGRQLMQIKCTPNILFS